MKCKYLQLSLAAATLAALSACGGGSDDSSATADPIDKYMGKFVTNCQTDAAVTKPNAKNPSVTDTLQVQLTLDSPIKVSATKAVFQLTLRTYANEKMDCSGQPVNTVTVNSLDGNTFLQVDGTATIGTQAVDKVTFGRGVYFPGLSASSITMNDVKYSGKGYTYQSPQISKDIALLQGNAWYDGDFSMALDAQGYPTALAATPQGTFQATKQ